MAPVSELSEVFENDIRALEPYSQSEYRAALERLLHEKALALLVSEYFPGLPLSAFISMAEKLATVDEFQAKVIAPAIDSMLKSASEGITLSGLDQLARERKYLYLSNHRDILCDPALLTQRLCLAGYGTPRICLGDNLLTGPFVIDLIKMNKGVTVKRGLAPRELLRWSHVLSELILRTIRQDRDSVWIVQREGRTKDGDDQTHPGVLKMLTMAGEGSLIERIAALHVVPVAISYEYDPCDIYKARELYLVATQGTYVKRAGEDHRSMVEGIRSFKGRIEIGFGDELGASSDALRQASALEGKGKKEQLHSIARSIDRQVHRLYRCWPSHWIARDLLACDEGSAEQYTPALKHKFVERMESRLDGLEPELRGSSQRLGVRQKFLEAYANPVRNSLAANIQDR